MQLQMGCVKSEPLQQRGCDPPWSLKDFKPEILLSFALASVTLKTAVLTSLGGENDVLPSTKSILDQLPFCRDWFFHKQQQQDHEGGFWIYPRAQSWNFS